ncbi:MAG: hypothetical protein EOP60_07185 [Sphingomonadales bacterium]|nr:MAG: hypothetical protein EOP60_07185 [Sphingomonadales bacterium]
MPVRADLEIDAAQLRQFSDTMTRKYLRAGKETIAETTKWLERELEALTRDAVPGRLWRAWASKVYPRGAQIAREPVGEVYVNGSERTKGAMTFWSSSGRIRGKADQWLAIPTDAAGSTGRGRNLTPGQWEAQTGQRLRFIYRGGRRSALLVADGTTNRRSGDYRPITRKRTMADERRGFVRGAQSVIIFVLVPSVAFGNRIAIEPAIERARGRIAQDFLARVGRIG